MTLPAAAVRAGSWTRNIKPGLRGPWPSGRLRDLAISGAAVLFSTWVAMASGYTAVYDAMFILLIGIVAYIFLKVRREHLGQRISETLTGI